MALRGTWGAAKSTALALHSLVTTQYPQDAIEIIGFSDYARVISPTELAGLSWDMVQGTNLQHALMLAGRHLAKHRDAEPVVLVVTDGEPTAHLTRDGHAEFCLAAAAGDARADPGRGRAAAPGAGPPSTSSCSTTSRGWSRSSSELAQRNGGRVFSPRPETARRVRRQRLPPRPPGPPPRRLSARSVGGGLAAK